MDRTLHFGSRTVEPDIRTMSQMKDVLMDGRQGNDRELYYMYRDLSLSRRDSDLIKEHRLRYDITVIPPGMLGKEYIKTMGHYHPTVPGTGISYPEVYEVLNGEAHYLMQKQEVGNITDVVLIRASAGDKVIIPPDFGHVTINTGNRELKMANWVSRDFSSDYEPYIRKHGAAYYLVKEGMVPNPHYNNVMKVRQLQPRNFIELGLVRQKEMYGLVRNLDNLDFLNRPLDFGWLFDEVLS